MTTTTVIVWWLLFWNGYGYSSPVYLPEPFQSEVDCQSAAAVLKDSPADAFEGGVVVCVPQPISPPSM